MLDTETLVVVLILSNAVAVSLCVLERRTAERAKSLYNSIMEDVFSVARGTHEISMVDEDTICIERKKPDMGFNVTNQKED